MSENQIDTEKGTTVILCFPLFRWANTRHGIVITRTGIVGLIYSVNKDFTIYQFYCNHQNPNS